MGTRNDVSFWRRVLEEMAGPEARQVRLLSRNLAEVSAERDRLLGSLRELYVAALPAGQGDDLDDLLADGEGDVDFMVAFVVQRLEVLQQVTGQQDGGGRGQA